MTGVDDPRGFTRRRVWPPSREALIDSTRCPSCFTEIAASTCASCGLDLSDQRAYRVLDLSQRVARLLGDRDEVLAQMHADADRAFAAAAKTAAAAAAAERAAAERAAAEQAAATRPAAAAAERAAAEQAAATRPAAVALPSPTPVHAPPVDAMPAQVHAPVDAMPEPPRDVDPPTHPPAPTPAAPAGAPKKLPTGPTAPRRSGVQVFLLSIGVVLLAVAAAFFLTVAWVSGGLVLRSIIVALATVGVIVTASVLRRRRLTATAEGIALLGIALVALDVWAVRANDVAGAAGTDALLYWGSAALAAGVGFAAWARVSRLRVPLTTGVVALAGGPALIAAGAVGGDPLRAWYAAGLTLLLVTLAAPLAPRLSRGEHGSLVLEVAVLRGVAALGAVVGLSALLGLETGATWAPVVAALSLAAVIAAHAIIATRRGEQLIASVAAPAAVLVFGAGATMTVVRVADPTFTATAPLLVATVLFLALERAATRAGGATAGVALRVASLTAAAGGAIAALIPFALVVAAVAGPLRGLGRGFGRSAFAVDVPDAESTASALTLIAVVALVAVAWRLGGLWAARNPVIVWSTAVLALLVGPQLRVIGLVVLWYLAIAIAAVLLLRARRGRPEVWVSVGISALLAGWILSFSAPLTWAIATVTVAGVLWVVASLHRLVRVVAIVALVVFVSGSAFLVPVVIGIAFGVFVLVPGPLVVAAGVASLCLVAATIPFRSLDIANGMPRP
ncbi:hypothetical protein [Microbacterium sp. Bi128]|uniref:hypothetical protein n=1 Tax=Microbacterium sp. Bi128 TaxID=2821115 RepID=UPI001D3DE7E3|nr:hypothetical protein [Microbacterium sp. Bi128]CAH0272676.1 hypothetical protein SRABI128_03435 [Microbacterium sp. Bi128]